MKLTHRCQLHLTHFINKSVITVVTRPKSDSDIPILDIISISGGRGGFDVLYGLILSDMSCK